MKIGLVVALATNWGLFQTLVYDTLTKARPSWAPYCCQLGDGPFARLCCCRRVRRPAAVGDPDGQPRQSRAASMQGGPGFGAFAVNTGGMTLVLSTLGVLLASKVVLAILLALAPLVAGLMLFEATLGIVEGWLKAMIALAVHRWSPP
jgi:type IV secretion system protein VirB6